MKLYRNVIILAVVLGGLIGVYFYTKTLDKPVEDDSPTTESITIFKHERDDIAGVYVESNDERLSFVKQDDKWTLDGVTRILTSKADSLMYDVATINAEQTVEENAADLSAYGLDNPQRTITVNLNDGTSKIFYLGSATPTKSAYYFKDKDSDTVYTIYSYKAESFLNNKDTYRDKTVFNLKQDQIQELTVTGRNNISVHLRTEEDADDEFGAYLSSWMMTSPYNKPVEDDVFSKKVITPLSGASIKDFVQDGTDGLDKYGLSVPSYKIVARDDEKSLELLLGSQNGDDFYFMVGGEDNVYTIDKSAVSFVDINPFDLIARLSFIVNIDTVSKIVVTSTDKTDTMELTKLEDAEDDAEDKFEYKLNGNVVVESAFKSLYQEIIGIVYNGVSETVALPISDVSVEYYFNDGSPNVKMEYAPVDDRSYLVIKDGQSTGFYTLKKNVENMLAKIRETDEGSTKS